MFYPPGDILSQRTAAASYQREHSIYYYYAVYAITAFLTGTVLPTFLVLRRSVKSGGQRLATRLFSTRNPRASIDMGIVRESRVKGSVEDCTDIMGGPSNVDKSSVRGDINACSCIVGESRTGGGLDDGVGILGQSRGGVDDCASRGGVDDCPGIVGDARAGGGVDDCAGIVCESRAGGGVDVCAGIVDQSSTTSSVDDYASIEGKSRAGDDVNDCEDIVGGSRAEGRVDDCAGIVGESRAGGGVDDCADIVGQLRAGGGVDDCACWRWCRRLCGHRVGVKFRRRRRCLRGHRGRFK
jgi:hypothetical protein